MKNAKKKKWLYILLWVCCFLLVNFPIGAYFSVKLEPFVFGMPFSVFYFWSAYSLVILAGVVLAWKVMRD